MFSTDAMIPEISALESYPLVMSLAPLGIFFFWFRLLCIILETFFTEGNGQLYLVIFWPFLSFFISQLQSSLFSINQSIDLNISCSSFRSHHPLPRAKRVVDVTSPSAGPLFSQSVSLLPFTQPFSQPSSSLYHSMSPESQLFIHQYWILLQSVIHYKPKHHPITSEASDVMIQSRSFIFPLWFPSFKQSFSFFLPSQLCSFTLY